MKTKSPTASQENKVRNLERVLALNSILNSTLNLDELLGIIMKTAAEVMRADAASLMLIDESTQELVFKVALGEKGAELKEKFRLKMGEGIAGSVAQTGKSLNIADTSKDSRFAKRFDQATGFHSQAILCVPLKSREKKILGILQAINPQARPAFSNEDLELFEIFSDQAAIAVENAQLHAELIKQERLKQELQIAHQIQQNFLPDLTHEKFGLDIAAANIPAREVGGDFYDVIQLGNSKLGILIGDVSGKGVAAALLMVRTISTFRFLATYTADTAEMVSRLNDTLARDSQFGMFVTLFYLTIDKNNRQLEYTSAGHHPLLVRRPKSSELETLPNTGGTPVGLSADMPYEKATVLLEPGTALFLYTDGITEARSQKGQEYSVDRLRKLLQTGRLNAKDYTDCIFQDLSQFTQGAAQHDDMTVMTAVVE